MILALTFTALVTCDSMEMGMAWAAMIAVVIMFVLTVNLRPPGPPGVSSD